MGSGPLQVSKVDLAQNRGRNKSALDSKDVTGFVVNSKVGINANTWLI